MSEESNEDGPSFIDKRVEDSILPGVIWNVSVSDVLLYGLLHTSSAEAGILTGATPAFTVILAGLMLKESMNRTKLVGVLSTVGGVIVIQGFSSDVSFSIHHVWGNALVLCAAE